MKIYKIKGKSARRKMKVAAYCRVSTDKSQQEESFETQVRTYERMIRSNPNWQYAGIYSDEKSGTSDKREGFQRMIADAQDGAIEYILVKSISRFSRNVVDCRDYIERMQKYGVTIYFERENLESTAPGTSMMLSLMAAIAQDESKSNSENHRWAIQRRFERGEYKMGNHQILGYDADEQGKPIPNGDAWMIKMIFALYADGKSIDQVREAVNKAGGHCLRSNNPLSDAQIRYILKNEVYVGDRLLQKQHPKNYLTKRPDQSEEKQSRYMKNYHTGMIDRDIWEKVQQKLNAPKPDNGGLRKRRDSHFLTGLVFCAECAKAYQRRSFQETKKHASAPLESPNNYKAWKCRGRMKKCTNCEENAPRCTSPIARETQILKAIAEFLKEEPTKETVAARISKVLIGKEGIVVIGIKEKAA